MPQKKRTLLSVFFLQPAAENAVPAASTPANDIPKMRLLNFIFSPYITFNFFNQIQFYIYYPHYALIPPTFILLIIMSEQNANSTNTGASEIKSPAKYTG